MSALDDFKQVKDDITHKYEHQSSGALSAVLILVGVLLILIALFIDNPLIKASVLAWVTLP